MSLPTLNDNSEKENNAAGGIPSLPSMLDESEDIDSEYIENNEEFQELDVDELYSNEHENEDVYLEESNEELPVMSDNDDYLEDEDDYNPDYEEDLEEESKFIDKKKKRLIPFGGNKSKRKVKSSDFDGRKNVAGSAKIMRAFVLFIIFALFLFGIKNTFFPSHVYTDEQIRDFARQGAGRTAFPKERGEAFAENFISMYLTVDPEDKGTRDVLGYYYGLSSSDSLERSITNIEIGRDVSQKTLISPKVYESNVLNDYSAQFKLSSYVSSTDGSDMLDTGRWVTFSVNVYYDEENDSLSVTKDSPTLIPEFRISNTSNIPERMPLGNGEVNENIGPAINPTINGFVEAYGEVSMSNNEKILQYVDDKENLDLISGFGGSVKLKDDPQNSIKRTIYNSDDGIYRVELEVEWVDNRSYGDDKEITYISKYIMRVKPVEGEEGKYVVSRFAPIDYWK